MDDIDWNRRRPISERHVQALWYDGALRPKDLRTTDGLSVRVIDPGAWNVEAGPDFSHAVLEVGPARRRLKLKIAHDPGRLLVFSSAG